VATEIPKTTKTMLPSLLSPMSFSEVINENETPAATAEAEVQNANGSAHWAQMTALQLQGTQLVMTRRGNEKEDDAHVESERHVEEDEK
jgi:hypothetical protein